MKYELIEKHFGPDRVEYHVVFMDGRVIKAKQIFHKKEEAIRYMEKLEKP